MERKDYFIRARVAPDLKRRFKICCAHLNISVPKQLSEIIRKFVEVQEFNENIMKK